MGHVSVFRRFFRPSGGILTSHRKPHRAHRSCMLFRSATMTCGCLALHFGHFGSIICRIKMWRPGDRLSNYTATVSAAMNPHSLR
jgi:hypothetical protein